MAIEEEWFRNTKWSASTAEAFHEKLARARSQRDQYLVIQAMTLVRNHPEIALELVDLFLETRNADSDLNLLRGLEARAQALGELKRVAAFSEAYRAFFAAEMALPTVQGLASFNYPMSVARLKITSDYGTALGKSARAENLFGNATLSFLKTAARALIQWEQGHADAARNNADMAVRFGNIRRRGMWVSFDKEVVPFDDLTALKRILNILTRTTQL